MAVLEPEPGHPLLLATKMCQREEEKGIQETKNTGVSSPECTLESYVSL